MEEKFYPELVFGLVGAAGTNLSELSGILSDELLSVGYTTIPVRLSGLISQCYNWQHLQALADAPEDERIDKHMDAGDEIRRMMGRGDAVSLLAMSALRDFRKEKHSNSNVPLSRTAFVLNSLKHPDEIRTLRKIYGDSFILVSLYSPKARRIEELSEKIAKSRHRINADNYKNEAQKLVLKDEKEVGDNFGQNVHDTFPLADVFFADDNTLKNDVGRFIKLLFGYPFFTPTIDEFGMFMARASALRSADLSRQVGAVILTPEGSVVAAGCNEVPKAGGGAYWEIRKEDSANKIGNDYRDFQIGCDANAVMKHEMIREMFDLLQENGLLNSEKSVDDLADNALNDLKNPFLKESRVANIIEFGRIVHAEMHAISDAATRGIPLKDCQLYCTTFPCHMCARHIISTGINRVVYIDPYPKSMAKDLYKRAVRVDGDEADDDAVLFEPFVGVSPNKYVALFSFARRKDEKGYTLKWDAATSSPKLAHHLSKDLDEEMGFVSFLESFRDQLVGPVGINSGEENEK